MYECATIVDDENKQIALPFFKKIKIFSIRVMKFEKRDSVKYIYHTEISKKP
jgi:hypothetical protein